jgi:hypothetical protein
VSFDELADVIESVVVERYEHSFEELSALPQDARRLRRRRQSICGTMLSSSGRVAGDGGGLRARDRQQIQKALAEARKSRTEK